MTHALRGLVLLWTLAPAVALSQPYPNKPIRLVVPYSSGTTTDVLARLYAQKLSENLGQAVIVENKAGAGGNATNPALYAKLPFDSIRDFSHVTFLASAPNMLVVNSTVPANNMAELIAYA